MEIHPSEGFCVLVGRDFRLWCTMTLHDKLGLFCPINTARYSILSLRHLSRLALRTANRSAIYSLITKLQLPAFDWPIKAY